MHKVVIRESQTVQFCNHCLCFSCRAGRQAHKVVADEAKGSGLVNARSVKIVLPLLLKMLQFFPSWEMQSMQKRVNQELLLHFCFH